jgi:hypothetical protein
VRNVRQLCRPRHNRRVFLTTAEKLEIPHYALKKLANHVSSSDVTAGYIVVDVERLRGYMSKISDHNLAEARALTFSRAQAKLGSCLYITAMPVPGTRGVVPTGTTLSKVNS